MITRLAVVGCGQIAEAHCKAIAALAQAELHTAVDSDLDRARDTAQRHGAPHTTADYGDVLQDGDIDAVVLCLPHDLHAPFAIRAAEAGKHILVEKPMALHEHEAQAMVDAAEARGVQLSIGQSSRCIPSYWKAREIIASGAIGRVVNVLHQRLHYIEALSTDWRRDLDACGGLYLPIFGSHDIDAILWILGALPRRIWSSLLSSGHLSAGDSDGVVGMELASGAIASLTFALRCRHQRLETLFVGERGHLRLERNAVWLNGEAVELDTSEEAFTRQMRLFVEALQAGSAVPACGREVLAVVRAIELARRAHTSGQAQCFK